MDDLDEIELTEEEIDKYIPYRNEIQDILEKEGLAEFLKDFGTDLTDAEKMSIKSLICLRTKC